MYFLKVGPLCSLDAIKWLYLRPLSSLDKKLFTDTTLWLFTSRSLLLAIFLRNTDDQYQECCCESRSAVFCLYLCLFCLQILAQNANTDQFFVVHPILSRQLEGVSKIDASEIQKRKLFPISIWNFAAALSFSFKRSISYRSCILFKLLLFSAKSWEIPTKNGNIFYLNWRHPVKRCSPKKD